MHAIHKLFNWYKNTYVLKKNDVAIILVNDNNKHT